MEHIYFEAQLCSEIAILKEKSKKAKKQKITFGGWRKMKARMHPRSSSHGKCEILSLGWSALRIWNKYEFFKNRLQAYTYQ